MSLKRGAQVDTENADGASALMFAVDRSDRATVRLLLDRGASVNVATSGGGTVLRKGKDEIGRFAQLKAPNGWWFQRTSDTGIARMLREAGAR